ncbi:uncharacterized protein LOC107814538 isoform X2 [Nicotiana tabacum]|uniref:Uncharacterized protein LOC107814538 isoform X2 n=1 Tax=Nicotiana tabacum TaxID=4097 RepID=A0AC58SVR9_TOBAC
MMLEASNWLLKVSLVKNDMWISKFCFDCLSSSHANSYDLFHVFSIDQVRNTVREMFFYMDCFPSCIHKLLEPFLEGRPDDRLFTSAAITKRHDTVTLVTVDGITILVSGLINRARTLQNGFSSEVCNQFLIGFPYNWKESAALPFGESTNEDTAFGLPGFSESKASADRTSSSFSMPIDHLTATVLRDILISSAGNLEGGMLRNSIFREIVQKYGTNAFNIGEASCLNQKSSNQVTTEDPSLNENPIQKMKAKTNWKQEDSCTPDAKSGKEDFQQATPEDIPEKSVLSRMLHKSGDNASILGENSCLNQKSGTQLISRSLLLDETAYQKKKAAANLKNEDDNHVPDAQSRKEVLQKCNDESGAGIDNNSSSSNPFTRSKDTLYKKITVNQKEEEKRDVHKVEFLLGDFEILNHATSSNNGPLTRSRAQKQV